jgi:hypothetical protein
MRQANLRTLAARGIEIRGALKLRGIEAYEATDSRGNKLLVVSGGLPGPSWASVGHMLEQHQVPHTITMLGKPYFLSADTRELRKVLSLMPLISRTSAREEIFVQDVGFLQSELKKKFDFRVLIAPLVILILSLGFALFQTPKPATQTAQEDPTRKLSCALELGEAEFHSWLKMQLSENKLATASQLAIQTELGTLTLEIDQVLGSTQLIDGTLSCDDGRTDLFQFRSDSQQVGDLFELGERLDP